MVGGLLAAGRGGAGKETDGAGKDVATGVSGLKLGTGNGLGLKGVGNAGNDGLEALGND